MKSRIYVLLAITCAILASISCSKPTGSFEYASAYYKIQLTDSAPFIRYFSVDALGNSKLDHNPIRWKTPEQLVEYELRKISGSEVKICRKGSGKPHWLIKFEEQQFKVTSYYRNDTTGQGLEFRFDKRKNHATLLGLMEGKRKTRLPAVLHLPDMGTFQIRADFPGLL